MRFTERDIQLVRDLALSFVLSRDQVIELGYFDSVTRCNTRLRELAAVNAVRRITTPFHAQSLYIAGTLAGELCGERIERLLADRIGSPRFLRHALASANVRIALQKRGGTGWRFEQQLWRTVGRHEIRPDGLIVLKGNPTFIEVDLGHVSGPKFTEKLKGYSLLAGGTTCADLYGFAKGRLLIVTTSPRRARHLRALTSDHTKLECLVTTFEELGAPPVGCWS
ncbi:MAG: replication-relaxation family protein [Fimbriimonadaceae bacterium]|nr:replication-relaxation family protein [Fimbriimonadaceae bacterium]